MRGRQICKPSLHDLHKPSAHPTHNTTSNNLKSISGERFSELYLDETSGVGSSEGRNGNTKAG